MGPRTDDPTIGDDEPLWRRILPSWIVHNSDGTPRPSSIAFLDGINGELSVHLAKRTNTEAVLADRPHDSIAELPAGVPRSLGHAIVHDPTPEDDSHALVCPPDNIPEKRRKRDARSMAVACCWAILKVPPPS
jgi:hypothetical protein